MSLDWPYSHFNIPAVANRRAGGIIPGPFNASAVSKQSRRMKRMAMPQGGNNAQQAVINVTPLIDVLLVLLIIFMVITPSESTGLKALVPQKGDQQQVLHPQNDI